MPTFVNTAFNRIFGIWPEIMLKSILIQWPEAKFWARLKGGAKPYKIFGPMGADSWAEADMAYHGDLFFLL